jgi:hypothetical protein
MQVPIVILQWDSCSILVLFDPENAQQQGEDNMVRNATTATVACLVCAPSVADMRITFFDAGQADANGQVIAAAGILNALRNLIQAQDGKHLDPGLAEYLAMGINNISEGL